MSKVTPEQAASVLQENAHLLPEPREWFESIRDGNLPQYYLKILLRRKSGSDELPRELVDYEHPDHSTIKCRATAITGARHDLLDIIGEGQVADTIVTDAEVIGKIKEMLGHPFNALKGGRKGEFMTTIEEIDLINRTLDTTIAYLKKTYKL